MQLDRIDRKLVAALMSDATQPVARLAERVGLTQTPCWKRIQKLQEAGVIRARVALVDPEQVGLGLTVFVGVSAPQQDARWHADFARVLEAIPEVMEAHQLAGSHDYALRVVVRDLADFDRVRGRITNAIAIGALSVQFAARRVKSVSVLPIDTCSA
ncbi:Lrp/AsnC family transcriptional regulator [Pseudooceanicola sediminis]|uniref:Lrp/AsnC family transcriptional regulator n=1 Tax=Pseudooceanicola sediminis TaxID=2211117 RepID=A0A399IUX9_9RHOB|nr:Lrp/AsnC family transcriptional regulator [Pseudooceanicola sediminis]KAA2316017.1 Lrp/AsnC family transcriptional regulator [Puniceibacterium sp. HSS470]RII36955.1 Lrp/AsnC family transcriptional regulator [Pseudooceanicola sediminis]|tara:strand:- start:17067 stop:17537 length:471 start_codon:yes stop_codon:yes gene_type:complete